MYEKCKTLMNRILKGFDRNYVLPLDLCDLLIFNLINNFYFYETK